MTKRTWVPAVTLAVALVLGSTTVALTQDKGPKAGGPPHGKHPHIHAAMKALQHADTQLERAAHHYGGHRARALELVKQAEAQLREAVAWADAHPEEFRKAGDKPAAQKK